MMYRPALPTDPGRVMLVEDLPGNAGSAKPVIYHAGVIGVGIIIQLAASASEPMVQCATSTTCPTATTR
ncbi:MAG: hypothetical protein QOD10_192 [Mycobacterium sp.]|jgi:hypothetical protein|nr:hypothetical protein [Mycobacterium sp.]